MARFNRFDIVEAWFVWLQIHHCGIVPDRLIWQPNGTTKQVPDRGNPKWWHSYNRLSFMPENLRFKPRPNLRVETLEENAFEIYQDLCTRLSKMSGKYTHNCKDDGLVQITENGEELEITMPEAIWLKGRDLIYYCAQDGQFHLKTNRSFDDVDEALKEWS